MMNKAFLTRQDLANRWQTHTRTIDRLRNAGLIPWVDISGGKGRRPIVRFHLKDVEAYENRMRMEPMKND